MTRKPKLVHPQLEELQSAAAAANVAVREAATAVQRAEAELEGLSTLVVTAYVEGDEARASKHRETVTGAEDNLADLRLRLEAQTQRASAASAAAAAFRAANAEQLITELKPQGETITVALRDALTQVVALDARWTDHAHRVNRLVAAAPGASPLLASLIASSWGSAVDSEDDLVLASIGISFRGLREWLMGWTRDTGSPLPLVRPREGTRSR